MTSDASSGADPLAAAATPAQVSTHSQSTTSRHALADTPPTQRLADIQEGLQQYVHEHLKALAQQLTFEQQRQRDRLEEELHKMRQQLAAIVQESQQQQQTMAAFLNETLDALRKEVTDSLQRLCQDVNSAIQQSEAQTTRALERLRNEMLRMFLERDHSMVPRHLLGDMLIALGKQLQHSEVASEDPAGT